MPTDPPTRDTPPSADSRSIKEHQDDAGLKSNAGRYPASVIRFLLIVVVMLGADLVSKHWAFEYVAGTPVRLTRQNSSDPGIIPPHTPTVMIPGVLSLRLTANTGALFGLGKGSQAIFIVVSILAVVVIGRVFWCSRPGAWVYHLSLGLILAGALGNLYDRIRFNAVRDLLLLFPDVMLPFGWRWPGGAGNTLGPREIYPWVFNIADAALVVGVILMLVVSWINDKRQRTDQTTPD